jgi:hypothetical protein
VPPTAFQFHREGYTGIGSHGLSMVVMRRKPHFAIQHEAEDRQGYLPVGGMMI